MGVATSAHGAMRPVALNSGIWEYGNYAHLPIDMKTTLEISDELLRRAKQAALDRNTTLRAIVEEALERSLSPAVQNVPFRNVTWPPPSPDGTPPPVRDDIDWIAEIRKMRAGPAEDPEWFARRMGIAPVDGDDD